MFENIVHDVELIKNVVIYYLSFTVGTIGLLFGINFLNNLVGGRLNYLGIIPRHILGIPGIILSPFLHGSSNHLIFNSLPLFALMNMILVQGYNVFLSVTIIIILLSGTLIWLFGRFSIHIGSSSVIMGYFGFLAIYAVLDPSFLSFILIIFCLYYFGGLVAALIPIHSQGVSVEGHIFGFLSGIASYFLWPDVMQWIRIMY